LSAPFNRLNFVVMPKAKHFKAAAFVHSQLFAGLTSFAQLESRIAALPDEKARDDAFEVFAEAFTPLLMMLEAQVREAKVSERSPEAGRLNELVQKCVKEIPSLANDSEIIRATKLLHKLRRCGFLLAAARPFQGGAPGLGKRK
jgi:hypothetical protein